MPDESSGRSAHADALWADTRIDPIEIALPGGVGYTLRGYRPASQLTRAEVTDGTEAELDDFDAAAAAVARRRLGERPPDDGPGEGTGPSERDRHHRVAGDKTTLDKATLDKATLDGAEVDENADEELDELAEPDEADENDEPDAQPEDLPVFLSRRGRLLLFHSPEKLVAFLRSPAEHDLQQLDTWDELVAQVQADDVAPKTDDSYELDLVVENLRGGSDVWDLALILKAGEIARDISFALKIEAVMTALAPGSPLDDLDNTLRTVDAGGVRSFFARLRMRKMPAQQSTLAWRTIIGKISAVADWRD